MSRIGKKSVKIPDGVKVHVDGAKVAVEGPKGKLEQTFRPEVSVAVKSETKDLFVTRTVESRTGRAQHGLARALIVNMIKGVTAGYERKLEIIGVGYLAAISGDTLQLRVGFAHEVHRKIPKGLKVTCPDQTHILIQGIDKQLVGQFAAEVRSVRKPEPYKGKGVRYDGEVVRRKAGKAMAK